MTKIEWTEATWNPFVGCEIRSAGCKNCYAMLMAWRQANMQTKHYQGLTKVVNGKPVWTGRLNRSPDTVFRKPLSVRKPTMWFVNSMSDFWHENADREWQRDALAIMDETPWHTYQLLTKRPEYIQAHLDELGRGLPGNVWLGATVEDHRVVDRIGVLRRVEATVRFLSVEPMTAPLGQVDLQGIHWVITGGESGHGARPCDPDWVREVRDQCIEQGVAFFHKQWGRPSNNPLAGGRTGKALADYIKRVDPHGKGGALLDGRLWREYPSAGVLAA